MNDVDTSLLSRDFNKVPVNVKNPPTKEDLEYLYRLGFRIIDVAKFFKVSMWCIETCAHKVGACTNRHNPLDKDLLYDLYIKQNLSEVEVGKRLSRSDATVRKYLKKYGIKKDEKGIVLCRENYFLNNYGFKNASQIQEFKEKKVSTCLKHRGTMYPTQCPDVINKIKKGCYAKYGVSSPKQIHISKKAIEVVSSKDSLIELITKQGLDTTYKLSQYLGANTLLVCRALKKFNLWGLIKSNTSSYEFQIRETLNSVYFNRDRTILEGREIDLYSDKHKIGIEFNGNYWHCEKYKPNKRYHQKKSLDALKKGVFIYHIWEYEWHDPRTRQAIINQLHNIFGLNQNKIYARNCEIREVNTEEKNLFLRSNHLQGIDRSSVAKGLYYNNELVSLMTFCKPRFNKNYEWELSRFCSKAGYNVVGGASKLFKYFIKAHNPKSIISYSDIAKTTGNIYKVLGFKNTKISLPNYVWTNGIKVLSRYQCQKHKLVKQGFDISKSENQIMTELGYNKLYDCGNKIWVITFS